MGQPMEHFDDDESTTTSNNSTQNENAPPARLINFRTESALRQASHSPAPATYPPVYQPTSSSYQAFGNMWSARSPVYSSPADPEDPFVVAPTSHPITDDPIYRPTLPVQGRDTGGNARSNGVTAPPYRAISPVHASEASRHGPDNQSDNDPFARLFRPDSPAFEPDSPELGPTTPPSGLQPVQPVSPRNDTASSSDTSATEIERRELRLRAYDALIAINSLNRLHPDELAPRPERCMDVGDVQLPESAVIDAAISYIRSIRQDALAEAALLLAEGRGNPGQEYDH